MWLTEPRVQMRHLLCAGDRLLPHADRDGGRTEVVRLDVLVQDELLPGGTRRCFLWPRSEPPLPPPLPGVQVWHPTATAAVLTQGATAWPPSAFDERTAPVGRRLSRFLTRSVRKRATVPLFAMSLDGTSISCGPDAWGPPQAWLRLASPPVHGRGLLFVTEDVTPRATPAPPDDDRSLYEDGAASVAEGRLTPAAGDAGAGRRGPFAPCRRRLAMTHPAGSRCSGQWQQLDATGPAAEPAHPASQPAGQRRPAAGHAVRDAGRRLPHDPALRHGPGRPRP